jgi:hypothetical protein
VDHLIHTLMEEFLPDLEIRHERQTLGMEGPNLAEKRRRQILKRAPETPLGKIQKMDDSHFEVQSSKTNQSYHIDLNTITCNCRDFPRIRLCKHIAAVAHFFGGVDLGPRPPVSPPGLCAQDVLRPSEDREELDKLLHASDVISMRLFSLEFDSELLMMSACSIWLHSVTHLEYAIDPDLFCV